MFTISAIGSVSRLYRTRQSLQYSFVLVVLKDMKIYILMKSKLLWYPIEGTKILKYNLLPKSTSSSKLRLQSHNASNHENQVEPTKSPFSELLKHKRSLAIIFTTFKICFCSWRVSTISYDDIAFFAFRCLDVA